MLFQDKIPWFSLIFFMKCYSSSSDFPSYSYHIFQQICVKESLYPIFAVQTCGFIKCRTALQNDCTEQNAIHKGENSTGCVTEYRERFASLKWNNSNSKTSLIFPDFSKYLPCPLIFLDFSKISSFFPDFPDFSKYLPFSLIFPDFSKYLSFSSIFFDFSKISFSFPDFPWFFKISSFFLDLSKYFSFSLIFPDLSKYLPFPLTCLDFSKYLPFSLTFLDWK